MTLLRTLRYYIPAFLALAWPAYAQDDENPCEQEGACRWISEYVFQGPNGEEARVEAGLDLPWVMQGNVILTHHEAVVVELVEQGGELVPELRRTGAEARDGELATGEILFDISGVELGQITLTVRSAYPEPLEYAALIVDAADGPSRTSVCTLMPGVAVFENWQQPIYQIAAWSFRPAEEGNACKIIQVGDKATSSGRD